MATRRIQELWESVSYDVAEGNTGPEVDQKVESAVIQILSTMSDVKPRRAFWTRLGNYGEHMISMEDREALAELLLEMPKLSAGWQRVLTSLYPELGTAKSGHTGVQRSSTMSTENNGSKPRPKLKMPVCKDTDSFIEFAEFLQKFEFKAKQFDFSHLEALQRSQCTSFESYFNNIFENGSWVSDSMETSIHS